MSSRMSMYRRVMGMVGAGALALGGVGAILANSGIAYASPVSSSPYTIGYPLSGVTFAASNSVATDASVYTLNFTVPSGDSSPSGTVYLSGLPGSVSSSAGTYVVVVNGTNTTGNTLTYDATTGVYTLTTATGTLAAGDTVSLTLSGTNGSAGIYTPAVSLDAYSGAASNVTISPTSVSANASASASSNVAGAGAVSDSFSGFALANSSSSSSLYVQLSQASQSFPSDPADYTVKVTSGSTTSTDAVTSVSGGNGGLTGANFYTLSLNLQNSVPADATVSVQVSGVTNLSYTSPTYVKLLAATPGAALSSTTLSPDLAMYLQPSSLTATLQLSDTQQSATSNWTSTFTLPSGYTAAATGSSNAITAALNGATWTGTWALIVNGAVTTGTEAGGITLPSAAAEGNSVTLELFGVKNPDSSTAMLGLTVGTATGATGASSYSYASPAVSLTAASSSANVVVTPSSEVPGASATYTVNGLAAAEALTGGASGTPIHLVFPSGTVLPTAVSDYTLTDLTSSSSSGVYSVTYTSGDAEAGVTILPANNIASGDDLMITISGVTNPPTASATDVMSYGNTALVAATQQAAAVSVPTAATTYPNGALIQSGGQIDVVAGGHAFGIPSPTVFGKIRAMDKSGVVAGSFPTASAPAPGTLINPVGTSGYWVVGTNGEIYQFSSMSQFMKDGYITSQVIPVPNTGGLTAGAGAPPTAANTMANGSLVQFGSTIYEYAGGIATGIATPAQLAAIQKVTGAMVVMGSGSTPTSASTSANGTLVQPLGKAGVWVSNSGTLYQFMSASQFTTDGYSFQYVLPVAMTGSYTLSSI